MMTPLLLSHATLMRTPFPTRLRAAQAAGFAYASMFISEAFRFHRAGGALRAIADCAAQYDVPIRDIEVLSGWVSSSGDAERHYRATEDFAFALAEAVGAKNIQAIAPIGEDIAAAARSFGRLCDRAALAGMTVALEFMLHTDLPDLATAHHLIDRAGRANGGLCVDAFHLFHAGDTVESVARLPRTTIKSVQLNDGPLAPFDDYESAMMSRRIACGDGEFPMAELLSALEGVECPLGIEVFNPALWDKDPIDGARDQAMKLRRLLGEG